MKKLINNIIILFCIFFYILISVGCHILNESNVPNVDSGLFTREITVDGIDRRYAIYIPKNIENISVPLIFELHGGGIYIEDMTGESGYKTPYKLWMKLAEKEKFIVVYPEGLNGVYNKPTWNDCREDCIVNSNADDVYFIETLIESISNIYKIDANRIYVSGTSNGGFMALRLGIELNDKIAAIAVVAAAMPAVSKCSHPTNPISVLFMNGTDDNHMPYYGGYIGNPPNPDHGSVISTEKSVNYWVNINHTEKIPISYVFPDLDKDDGGIVEKFTYESGIQGTEVFFYKVNGGGHSAPSIKEQYSALFEQYFNRQNHDIEMTTEVWNFFKNKRLKQ